MIPVTGTIINVTFKILKMKTIQQKRKSFHFSVFLLLFLTSPIFAQLASWNPAGLSGYGPSPWTSTTSNASLTVGGLTRGAGVGLTGTPAGNAWGGVNWAGASNQDATFTVTANSGYSVSYSVFNLSYRRSNTGPNAGTLEYTFGSSSTYTVISTISNFTSTATSGVPITPINLSGVANLQNVPAGTVVKFRIFPTGGSSAGTWYIFGTAGMSIGGTVTSASASYTSSISQTAPVLCNGQSGAALTVSVTGSTLPYTYSWSPSGGTSSVATGLAAGVYSCLVTSATSATTMSTYTITEPASLSSAISAQNNNGCNGGSIGSVTVTANGGTPSYTYSWLPSGGTASTVGNLTAGTYTLNIMDGNNCMTSQTVSITEPAALFSMVSSQNNVTCNSGSNGSATVTVNGGTPSFTYNWLPIGGTASTATNLTAGNYTLTITDANNCTALQTVSITEPAVLSTTVSSQNNVTCNGGSNGSATVTVNGGTPSYTYNWLPTGGTASTANNLIAGNYTLAVTDANNCTESQTLSITEPATVTTISATTAHSVICNGSTVTLNGVGATTYTWTSNITNGVAFSPSVTTTYTVNGTDLNGCVASAMISVTVNPLPTLNTFVSPASTICAGSSLTLTASGATTYTWTGGITNGVLFTPTSSASYTVTGTDVNGCTGTTTRSITVNSLPTVTATVTNSVICNGTSVTLNAGGANTYTWTNGVGNGVAFTPSNTVTYTVTGTNAAGCTNTAVKTITVNALPTVNSLASPSSTICAGSTLTLSGNGASTYTWTNGVANGIAFTPTSSASYTVTGTDANGCTNTATRSITVNSLPTITATVTSSIICNGAPVTLNASGATTYTWTGGVTNGVAFTPTSSASYTVTGTNVNGCINTATRSITVNSLPTLTTTVTNSVICNGTSVTLNAGGATTYTWTNGVTNGIAFTPTNTATYTVTGTDATGCTNTAVKTITVNALPSLNTLASPSSTVCAGSALTLTASGATTYIWTGGVTNGVAFTPTSSASYTVTGTDANGCAGIATRSVTVSSSPTVTANATNSVICNGAPVTLNASGATTYTWTGGVTNGVAFTPGNTATYTVTGANATGCTNTAVKTITVNALPALGATTNKALICTGQTATITALGAVSYTWSTTQTASSISVSPTVTTTYTVNGTGTNGCVGTVAFTQSVSACTAIEQISTTGLEVNSYPNPNNGEFTVESNVDINLNLINSLGELVRVIELNNSNNHQAKLEELSMGMYILTEQHTARTVKQKIIVTH